MLWGSRFDQPPDELFARFNNSFHFDWRLYDADIRGSIAYAHAIERVGLLSAEEAAALEQGLEQVRDEFARGAFAAQPDDEDIHTAVERRLYELTGAPAHKLHTGRSRNDQVATDTRLYVMDTLQQVDEQVRAVQSALVEQAGVHLDILLPGYTHVRRAQPILFSHYLLSFFWMLQRDRERIAGTRQRAAVLPLGAGALAGNAFNIDRGLLARELGFDRVSENSLDAVSDRDFIVEFLFDAALLQVHLSRLAEDLILYSSPEFGFIQIADAYATGSSLMPQKKNPDSLELVRGKTGRLVGNLNTLLVTLKGLPSTYDKDLQEDKEPLFDTLDTLALVLPVVAGVIRTLTVYPDRMRAALDDSMLATDLADYLVRRGVPFREAHGIAGKLVKYAEANKLTLSRLSPADYAAVSNRFGEDVLESLDFERSVRSRDLPGGTGPNAVRAQLAQAKALLAEGK
ncbi:MAG: argininosuccinate lyase [Anaerolineae bacterium]